MNKERTIVSLLRELSNENGYKFRTFSYDWVKEIRNATKTAYVFGYNFPINSTSFTQIANDKACTSEILTSLGIPNIEHSYFMSPNDIHYVKYLGVNGNWKQMLDLLSKYGKIICKPNSGTGGADLYIVTDESELEFAVNDIFSKTSTLCICPYYEIEDEYRAIILDGTVRLMFRKIRPFIIGNGNDNIAALCAKHGKKVDSSLNIDVAYVPNKGERIEIGWKHNLGQGSCPEILSSGDVYNRVSNLAVNTLEVLGGRFASVDCVKIDGKFCVLEVNSGVMMDNFAVSSEENYMTAKEIYLEAVKIHFNE